MKKSETHSAQKECREPLIFLLVTYGIPYLMIIPMAILTDMGKKVDFFVSAQMFCPAAGLLVAKLLCDKRQALYAKKFLHWLFSADRDHSFVVFYHFLLAVSASFDWWNGSIYHYCFGIY